MKQIFLVILCMFFIPSFVHAGGGKPLENKYVKCDIALQQKHLKAGTTAHVLITFTPIAGIHVNGKPAMEIKIDSTNSIAAVGKPEIPLSKKTGYVESRKQIRVPFTLAKDLKSGPFSITGTLTYYYCSDADGWCSRYKQPISLTTVVQ